MRGHMNLIRLLFVLMIGSTLCSCSSKEHSETTASPTLEKFSANHPSTEEAFEELYGSKDQHQFMIDATHLATPWFSKELSDGLTETFVLFSQVQELDNAGRPTGCHACGAKIDAITYIKKKNGWTLELIQRNLAELGSWGKPPAATTVDLISLTSGNVLLAIPDQSNGQGITDEWLNLLNHFQSKWRYVGNIKVSGDNQGTSCSKHGEQSNEGECYKFKGTYKLEKGSSLTYPDIVISKTGTEWVSLSNTVVPAPTERYSFNGTEYISGLTLQENKNAEAANKLYKEKMDKEATSEAAKKAGDNLEYCLMPAAEFGEYSSFDGGKSAIRMLAEKCHSEFLAWTKACQADGKSDGDCTFTAGIGAQLAIKKFGK